MPIESISEDKVNQEIRLSDGRRLGFAEFGTAAGLPVIYFHGWPSSRLEAQAMGNLCREMKVRLIAPDRPGLGLSDFLPGRTIRGFCDDVLELAGWLNLERFSVLGVSGGGPYAVACAACIPDRVSVALLVCSVAPCDAPEAMKGMVAVNRWLLSLARHYPQIAQCLAGVCLRAIWRKGNRALPKQIEDKLPPADRQALTSEDLRNTLTASSVEALRNGVRGAATDGLLYGRPWGFALKDIRTPVFLWHGERDIIVPPSMGHYLAEQIPGCRAQFLAEDGHFSLPFTKLRAVLSEAR